MKQALGLILFLFSFSVCADNRLHLRARVPETLKIKIEWNKNVPKPLIISNNSHKHPKVRIENKVEYYLVSVTHP